jgi:hypothetical protein
MPTLGFFFPFIKVYYNFSVTPVVVSCDAVEVGSTALISNHPITARLLSRCLLLIQIIEGRGSSGKSPTTLS